MFSFLSSFIDKHPVAGMLGFGSIGGGSAVTLQQAEEWFQAFGAFFAMVGYFFGMLSAILGFVGVSWTIWRRKKRKDKEKMELKRRSSDKED